MTSAGGDRHLPLQRLEPKEEFLLQQAGDGGFGSSSYINSIVSRYKDANTAWTSASDVAIGGWSGLRRAAELPTEIPEEPKKQTNLL